jgi:hypothetical protein
MGTLHATVHGSMERGNGRKLNALSVFSNMHFLTLQCLQPDSLKHSIAYISVQPVPFLSPPRWLFLTRGSNP